jgi:hypothetical protein
MRNANELNDFDLGLVGGGFYDIFDIALRLSNYAGKTSRGLLEDGIGAMLKEGLSGKETNLLKASQKEIDSGKLDPVKLIESGADPDAILNALEGLSFWKIGPSPNLDKVKNLKIFVARTKQQWPPGDNNLMVQFPEFSAAKKAAPEVMTPLRTSDEFEAYMDYVRSKIPGKKGGVKGKVKDAPSLKDAYAGPADKTTANPDGRFNDAVSTSSRSSVESALERIRASQKNGTTNLQV